jgi:type II secretory pathway component PulK
MLGLIFATALMVAAFVEASMGTLRYKSQDSNTAALRPYAYSALEITLARIREYQLIKENIYNILPEWKQPASDLIAFPDGMEFNIRIEDESSRVGINTIADKSQWIRILERYNVSSYEAEQMAEAFLDWTDSDDQERPFGAEADTYERDNSPYLPPNAPVISIDELAQIRGFDRYWWTEEGTLSRMALDFKNIFSTLSTEPPNINTASAAVLNYLTDDPLEAASILNTRSGNDGILNTEDDEFVESSLQLQSEGFNLLEDVSYTSKLFIIEIETNWRGARFTLSALVTLDSATSENSDSQYPFKLLKLSENNRFSKDTVSSDMETDRLFN